MCIQLVIQLLIIKIQLESATWVIPVVSKIKYN